MKTILTIAGSDTSAGAGIQQDLKTVTALGHYAVTVPTALTAQNTVEVRKVMAVPEDMLRAQLEAVMDDIAIDAVKIGMLPDVQSARIVAEAVRRLGVPTVLDPVMVSTSGTALMADECVEYIKKELFPLCALVTPNLPEARRLLGIAEGMEAREPEAGATGTETGAEEMGRRLVNEHGTAFLVKGGHAEGDVMTDLLFCDDGAVHAFHSPRIASSNLHGTGCTLSSAVATLLASGCTLPEAVAGAKELVSEGIRKGRHLCIGRGNGPLSFH